MQDTASNTADLDASSRDISSAAGRIQGLMDDDGHVNDGVPSRALTDDDSSEGGTGSRTRDDNGRFKKADSASPGNNADTDEDSEAESNASTEDASDGDTDEKLAQSDQETGTSDEETESIENLADLAEALSMSKDDLLTSLSDTFTANGESVTVTLAELRDGYRKDADYRKSTAEIAETRRRMDNESREQMHRFERAAHEQAAQFNALESVFANELNSPAMAELRQKNPAEWTARREEIGQQIGHIRNQRQQAAASFDETMLAQMKEMRDRSAEALRTAIPDFGDGHRGQAVEVMQSFGFNEDEIGQVYDHRIVVAAIELHALRAENAALKKTQSEAKAAAKRIKKDVPKMVKGGKMPSAGSSKGLDRNQLNQLRTRLAKTKHVNDAAKVIEHLL